MRARSVSTSAYGVWLHQVHFQSAGRPERGREKTASMVGDKPLQSDKSGEWEYPMQWIYSIEIASSSTKKPFRVNYNDPTRPNSPQMVAYVGNSPPTSLFQVGEIL